MENNENITEKEKPNFIDEALDWIASIAKACAIALLICTFILKPAVVVGESMLPTLKNRDLLILRSFMYTPRQGDIIAANCENLNGGEVIIKRIVACPGQTVSIDFSAGKVYVDGEEFLVNGIENITTRKEGRDIENLTLPENKYFVMGDNRQNSTDSRDARVDLVDRDDILGKAALRLYPLSGFGGLYK